MQRRKFLQRAALGAAAVSTFSFCQSAEETQQSDAETTPEAQRNPTDSTRKLGVALLGLGSYSRGQLAPALERTRYCELRGLVTGTPDKVPAWQAQYGVPDANVYSYETLPTIRNNADLDVVYIVVPTGLHARYAIAAAEAGKHVWCEKPMAMTVVECQEIIDACNANGVKLSIGYRMQHEPNTRTLIEYATTKPYGEITGVRAEAGYCCLQNSAWRFDAELGGGALYDMGVYAINALRYATGMEPTEVISARSSTKRPELFTEVDETTEFQLRFPNGLVGYGKTSVGESTNVLRVDCERGWYELSPMQQYTGVGGRTSDGKVFEPIEGKQQTLQMDNDALAILADRPVLVPGAEGLRDIAIVNAIREAARTGRAVML